MSYRILYRRQAVTYLRRMTKERREQVLGRIERLAVLPPDPDLDIKVMARRKAFRLRVGAIRVIFERNEEEWIVLVLLIRSRGDVYKR